MGTIKAEIDNELVEKAQGYQQVVSDARWKRLLDNLARLNDSVLSRIRLCQPHEREKIAELAIMWKHYEEYLTLIQNEVLGTIEDRNRYVREVLKGRLPEEQIEDLIRRNNG